MTISPMSANSFVSGQTLVESLVGSFGSASWARSLYLMGRLCVRRHSRSSNWKFLDECLPYQR
jgi:hypothetical protein